MVKEYWEDVQTTLSKTTYKDALYVGWLFEDVAHFTLAQGGAFEFRDLNTQQRGVLEILRRTLRVVRAGLQEFLGLAVAGEFQGFYLVPESRTMPVVDSAEGGTDEVYQITFNPKTLNDTLREKKELNLVFNWVVPESVFLQFAARPVPAEFPGRLQQRVLKIIPVQPEADYEQVQ